MGSRRPTSAMPHGALITSHGTFAAGVGISGRMLSDESATTFYMTGAGDAGPRISARPGAVQRPKPGSGN